MFLYHTPTYSLIHLSLIQIRLFPEMLTEIEKVNFIPVNREDSSSVSKALLSSSDNNKKSRFDLVVNTAGPFQGKVNVPNGILEACVNEEHPTPYIDVCDDYCTARAYKSQFHEQAVQNGVPCIVSTGCWVSICILCCSLHGQYVFYHVLTTKIQHENSTYYFYIKQPGVSSLMAKQLSRAILKKNPNLEPKDLTVDFSFFTAGSGGAGMYIL